MLSFRSMTLVNFGPYKGEQKIEFPKRDGVVIFWGDNGRGKTTLLNAFRFALFGTIQRRNNALNSLMSMENSEAHASGDYGFQIILNMKNDQDDYLLTREFMPRPGVHTPTKEEDYAKGYYLKKNGSRLSHEDAKHELNTLLPERVSRFFLFDGELLQEYEELLIDDTTTGERIKNAIERILGVPVLTNARQDTDDIRNTLNKQKTKAVQNDSQANKFANTLNAIETGIEEHRKHINDLDQELKVQYKEQIHIEDLMRKTEQLREWQSEIDSLRKSKARNEKARDEQLLEMRATAKDMWRGMLRRRIDECLSDLRDRISLLEVRKNQKTILDKVVGDIRKAVTERTCPVCEQAVEGNAWEILNKRLQESVLEAGLTVEEQDELLKVRGRIDLLSGMLRDSARSKVRAIESQLASLGLDIDSDGTRIQEYQKRAAEYSGDSEAVRELPVKHLRIMQKIDNLASSKKGESEKLDELRGKREQLMIQIGRLAGGSALKEATRKLDLCNHIYSLFEQGVGKYREKLRSKIEHDATDLFVSISGDPDYTSLQINSSYGLSIVHRTGSLVPGRSSGYEHIVALSLIGALHKNAPMRGPIIMDSPFFRLDKTHKKNIARTLPHMADQVILLAYNGEIDRGVALDELKDNLVREYSLQRVSSMHTHIEQGVS